MDQLTSAAIGEYGVIVAALGGVVVYLFKTLQKSIRHRIDALELAVDSCLAKHDECERRNDECEQRNGALAIRVAVLEQRVGPE